MAGIMLALIYTQIALMGAITGGICAWLMFGE